jgi:hypothetical protein
MNYDGARPNLFQCELTFPTLVSGSGAQQKFTFMARAAQLPGSTVNQIPQFYFGRELKFSGNRSFPEWTVTIINDEDFIIRDAFEKWMSGLDSHVANLRTPEFIKGDNGYQQDGFVTQYGKTGDIIKRYKFVGLFPIDVSPIELDWGANDTIEEYAVTFAYQWWEWAGGNNGPTTDAVGASVITSPILPRIE